MDSTISTKPFFFRPTLDSDHTTITEWIARDPYHSAHAMTAEFFYRPDSLRFAIADDKGPVMFFRLDPVDADIVRMYIQFDSKETKRNALGLVRCFPAVAENIRKANLRYIIFDSVSEPLIRFCQKRFGFVRVEDTNDYFTDLRY